MPCRIEEFIQAIWSDLISWAGHKAFYYFALPLINVSCTAVLHNTRKTRLQRRMHAKWIRRRDNRACKMDPRSAICIFSPPMQSAFALYVFLDFQPASLSLSSYPSCISLLGTAAHGMVLRRCPLSCTTASSLYAQLPKKHGTDGRGIFSCSCRRFAGTWRGDAEGGVGQGAGILPDRLLKATPVCLNWLHAWRSRGRGRLKEHNTNGWPKCISRVGDNTMQTGHVFPTFYAKRQMHNKFGYSRLGSALDKLLHSAILHEFVSLYQGANVLVYQLLTFFSQTGGLVHWTLVLG
jgi:hypothetical protein